MGRKYIKYGIIGGVIFVLLACVVISAAVSDIKKADRLIDTKQAANIEKAIAMLDDLLSDEPNNGEVLWVMAKAHLYLGDRSLDSEKLAIYEAGKDYADKAVESLPNCPHAHYWQAVLIGRVGETKGILNSLFMVRPLKEALDRVLELDEGYADAYFALSQLYLQAPGFPLSVGNKSKALEMAEKAVELEPDNAEFNVQLARTLLAYRRSSEAVEVLKRALQSPEMDIDNLLKDEAEKLLASIK